LIHLDVGGDFTGKVADLLQPDWGAGRLILLTGLLGALLTSLSTWSGFLIKTAFRPTARRSRRFY
jgi:hypothetical protein